jgi:hypothetical protein
MTSCADVAESPSTTVSATTRRKRLDWNVSRLFPYFIFSCVFPLYSAGNNLFRVAIAPAAKVYAKASTRREKHSVVRLVIEFIQIKGGRFLKRDISSDSWLVVPEDQVREKVGHAMRDMILSSRKWKQIRLEGISGVNWANKRASFASDVTILRASLRSLANISEGPHGYLYHGLVGHRRTVGYFPRDDSQSDSESTYSQFDLKRPQRDINDTPPSGSTTKFVRSSRQTDPSMEFLTEETCKQVIEIEKRLEAIHHELNALRGRRIGPHPYRISQSLPWSEQPACGRFPLQVTFAWKMCSSPTNFFSPTTAVVTPTKQESDDEFMAAIDDALGPLPQDAQDLLGINDGRS